jgi:hypothetical protein
MSDGGRVDDAGRWPWRFPLWTPLLCLLAIATGIGVGAYRYHTQLDLLEQRYLRTYAWTTFLPGFGDQGGRYRTLEVVTRTGRRLAVARDLRSDVRLQWFDDEHQHVRLHAELERHIYCGQTLQDLARPAVCAAAGVFALGLFVTVPKDRKRRREMRHGKKTKGPDLSSVWAFNQLTEADGLEIRQGTGIRKTW